MGSGLQVPFYNGLMLDHWRTFLVAPSGRPYERIVDGPDGTWLASPDDERVAVRSGIPRFVEDDFAESFGFQWNQFEVVQPEEDAATFEVKTGVAPARLAGLRVLDAGCGGGRYALVAATSGAHVAAVDRSRAIEKAAHLLADYPEALCVQADLADLPFPPGRFDLVYSIGVLHHSPNPRKAFRSIAAMVRPGGRLSIWVYRRNRWFQERINDLVRAAARRMPRERLLQWCRAAAHLGGVPVVRSTLNKVVNFSNHPVWELRVCDNFDWYSPAYQSHHDAGEVVDWFREEGFREIEELPPAKTGKMYRLLWRGGWIVGSGVNLTGVRRSASTGAVAGFAGS